MKAESISLRKTDLHYFKAPKTLVRRFVARKNARSSIILGAVIGLYMLLKTSTYIKAYPTDAARQKIGSVLGNNVGIRALLGHAHNVGLVSGYVVWNNLCLVATVGAIWGLLVATKTLRGEEDNNRWELLVSGQTTARKATINAVVGLASGLVIVYGLFCLSLVIIGRFHGADFSPSSIFFLALALIVGAAEFIAIGSLTSQLMPVRSRATSLAVGIFGIFYLIRVIADTTTATWLLDISPLGWIEKLSPMNNPQPIWLIPIALLIIASLGLAFYLAGKRDLGEGIVSEKQNIKSRYYLLKGPLSATLRLSRVNNLGWIYVISMLSIVYGQLAKSNIINTLAQSKNVNKTFGKLIHSASTNVTVTSFLAVAFFLIMLIIMFYAANAIGQIRSDEARGYLDNFLVRPVSRIRWLSSRLLIALGVISLGAILSSSLFLLTQLSQPNHIGYLILLKSAINAITPSILILGIGSLAYGLLPRLSVLIAYGAIAWSFLLFMLGSGLSLNHWLLDTSLLHHINFAPALSPNWKADITIILLGLLLSLIGLAAFNRRDLAGD